MVMVEIAMSIRPEAVAAKSAWKPRSSNSTAMPSRSPMACTRSTSKSSNSERSFLNSQGGLAG